MNVQKIWQVLLLGCLALAVACGDDSSKTKDLCADVECAGTCVAETGVCDDTCVVSEDCGAGVCDNGTCVVDQCADTTCDRGVCAVATGACVNSEACTTETEATDCLDGFSCYGQSCVSAEDFCSTLTCDRGVCSFAEKACANPDSCSMDAECLDGFFCDGGSCTQNVCDADMVMCARGVCEGTTGDCVNAPTCTTGTQCLDNNYCVSGACVDVPTACASCLGNQVCEYDQAMTVTCTEATFCNNTYDCLGDRICDAGACVEAGACVNDALEPFDASTAVAVAEGAGFISATICGTDEDGFSYDTLADTDFTGTLTVVVRLVPEHVGRGELALDLKNAAGTSVASGVTVNGVARLTKVIGNLDGGVYTLTVTGSGAISTAGLDYSVFMDMLDATTVAACEMPTVLAATQTGNTLSGGSLGLSPTCATSGSPAEDIFMFDVLTESVVTLTLTPANGADLVVSLRTTCEVDLSEVACVNDSATQEQFVGRLTPGRYFAVIQAASSNSGGEYTLTYSSELPICTAADNTCADVTVAQICNSAGTGFDMLTCAQGCDVALGRCARAESDVCYTAIDASNGYSGVIDWDLLTNDFEPEAACVPGVGTTDGPDAAFLVTLPPMSALTVELVSDGYDDVSIYLVRNCDDVERTCFAGVDSSGDDTLTYVNTRTTAESFYIIADVEDFYYDTASILIDVAPVICTPAAATCASGVLETCNAGGTAYISKNCGFGCDMAGTGCALPTNDVCGAGAVDISAGGSFMIDTTDYNNDYNLTSANCTGFGTGGNDAVYQISGQPGDVVDVELDAGFDSALYVLTDCSNFNSCLDGSDSGNPESIHFVLADTNPVYVIADGYSSGKGAATLNVTISTPDCTALGEAVACLDANNLQFCGSDGFLGSYTCTGGCAGGSCVTPSGDVCWDTIPILSGGSATGNFGNFTNKLDPGASCILSSDPAQDGGEAIYSINLIPGETLVADLTTTSTTAGMYVLSSCENNACEYGVGQSKHLEYYSATGGNYFLVVDNSSTLSSANFTLNVSTRAGDVCQPGGAMCDLAGNLTICADDGLSTTGTLNCPNGCSAGFCDAPASVNDTCASAMPISSDIRLRQSFGALTGDYNPGTSGCTGNSLAGPDAVYAITLAPGQNVEATVQSLTTSNVPAIYFVSDCSDVTTTCLAGKAGTNDRATFGYYSAAGETVYMVVDTQYSTSGSFVLDLKFNAAECTPATAVCSGSETLATCNSYGRYLETPCYFGCAAGACNPSTNDVCGAGALDVSAGGTFLIDTSTYTNTYNLPASGCTGHATAGNDAVYQISGQPGDVVDVELNASFDSALYVLTDCSNFTSCLDGSDSGNPESIHFVLTDTNPVYVVADGFSTTSKGSATLTVTVRTPDCTNLGQAVVCMDANNLQYCDSEGFLSTYVCAGGCAGSTCLTPSGDVCWDAIPLLSGGSATGNFGDFDNNLDPGASCILSSNPSQDGGEAIYAISLAPGETLVADLTTLSSTAGMYVLSSCANTACEYGVSEAKHLEYYSATGGNYFLVVDNTSTSSTSAFTLNVTTRAGDVCQPGGATCDLAGNLTICADDGLSMLGMASCPNGCSAGLCDAPATANNTCATAMPISSDIRLRHSFGALTANYNPGTAGCTGNSLAGPDSVYAITLAAGESVEASVLSLDTYNAPAIYFVSDCSDVTTTCLAGKAGTGNSATFGYYSAAGETIYMVVDTQYASPDTFVLDIAFKATACVPATKICGDANTLSTCNSYHTYDDSPCYFGCTAGACNPAPNDLCGAGAVDISAGGTFQLDTTSYANDYDLPSTGCTGHATAGNDAVYQISGQPGDFVDIELDAAFDSALYVLSDCSSFGSCLDGSDSGNPESIHFVLADTNPVYVVVDGYSTSAKGLATLTVTVRTPECTNLGQAIACIDANDLQYCDSSGFLATYTCTGGCVGSACATPTGDVCVDAIPIVASGTFQLNTSSSTNAYNLPSTGCTGYATAGKDVVYQLSGQPGDTVDITLSTTFDSALYALTDCSDFTSCLDGSDSGNPETIQFVLTDTNPVYVVVDAWSSGNGPATLTVMITPP